MTRSYLYVELQPETVPTNMRAVAEQVVVAAAFDLGMPVPAIRWYADELDEPTLHGRTRRADGRLLGGWVDYAATQEVWLRRLKPDPPAVFEVAVTAAHEVRHAYQNSVQWDANQDREEDAERYATKLVDQLYGEQRP